MKRRILIIDDHDDLASALTAEFAGLGHVVETVESRDDALSQKEVGAYDLVITDLDVDPAKGIPYSSNGSTCLPDAQVSERIKAFKLCAPCFHRNEFDEQELGELFQTVLTYKTKFVDTADSVRKLHEKIEFELPSALLPMHSILDYLTRRVEMMGVVDRGNSNLFVALDEAFVNAVKHGNKFDSGKMIRISADITPQEARFTVEDEGEGFDVNAIPDPLDPENLFRASGRGVLFIYNIMDEVEYNERGNRITMIKRTGPDNTA
jgi:serine/threonine-protein kinase RsbW